jgi:hypothetical protein
MHRTINRKPWSPTRAAKTSGRANNYQLMRQCLEKAQDPTIDPENRAEWKRRARYFWEQATRSHRHAYISRSGVNWYCNECGARHRCTKMVLENHPPEREQPAIYCQPCADQLGLSYYTSATYRTGDWNRYAYSL